MVACSTPKPATPPRSQESPTASRDGRKKLAQPASTDGQRMVTLIDDITNHLAALNGCSRVATVLSDWLAENKTEVVDLLVALDDVETAEAELLDRYLIRGYSDIAEIVYDCADDDALFEVFDAFEALVEQD